MTEQDRLGAAYHEAGHAVLATAFGLEVRRMEIGIGGDDAKGAVDVDGASRLEDQLTILAAGMAAQKKFKAPTNEYAGAIDKLKMHKLVSDRDEAEGCALKEAGHQRAWELVQLYCHDIERVARALMNAGKIEHAAAAELLRTVKRLPD